MVIVKMMKNCKKNDSTKMATVKTVTVKIVEKHVEKLLQ